MIYRYQRWHYELKFEYQPFYHLRSLVNRASQMVMMCDPLPGNKPSEAVRLALNFYDCNAPALMLA